MSAPKHLWSGDWQRESAALSDELAERRPRPQDGNASAAPTSPQATAPPTPRVSPPTPWAAPKQATEPRPAEPGSRTASARPSSRPPPARRRPRWLPVLPVVIAAALVLGAGAYGLSGLLSSSGNTAQPTQNQPPGGSPSSPPSQGSPASPTNAGTGPVNWLGMQVETLPPGVVVVETVAPGSPADLAGLEPGDLILAINNRRVNATGDIRPAISGLAAGDLVPIEVSRGSTLFTTQATLAAPPSGSP